MRAYPAKILSIAAVTLVLLTSVPFCSDGSVSGDFPENYNVDIDRGYDVLFPVRNQEHTGLCWAFSYSAAIESTLNLKYGSDTRLSPLAMACTHYDSDKEDDAFKYHDVYCRLNAVSVVQEGGLFFEQIFGPTSERIVIIPEYCASFDLVSDSYDYSETSDVLCDSNIVIKGTEYYDVQKDAELIKQRLSEGYVGVIVYLSRNMNFTDGTSNDYTPYLDYHPLNHSVALVGWDDSYDKEKFLETPSSDGAWRIRNSGGTEDDNDGYIWLSYETIIGYVIFITDAEYRISDGTAVNTYQYDLGYSITKDILCRDKAYMANIFTAEGNETLNGVSFSAYNNDYDTVGENYRISVYSLNDGYASPTDGTMIASASGTTEYQGIIYADLEKEVELSEGDIFSVVIELDNDIGNIVIPIDTEESGQSYHSYTAANPGESFININGSWQDISADGMSNVRIRAYTTSTVSGTVSSSDGTETFLSITDAIEHGTYDIKLLYDTTISSAIQSDEDIFIDLNSHSLTSTVPGYAIDMSGNKVTIRNGYLSSQYDMINADTVTLDNLTIECPGTAVNCSEINAHITKISNGGITVDGGGSSELFCCSTGSITFNGSDVTIIDGKYTDISFIDCDITIQEGDFSRISTSRGKCLIMYGNFNNNSYFSDDTSLTIEGGLGFKANEREDIEDRMAEWCFDEGFRAYGSREDSWFIVPCSVYIGDEPYFSLNDILLMDSASGVVRYDTYGDSITVTGDISVDLKGHTVDLDNIVIDSGASLTLYNGTVRIDDFNILSGGRLIIGSDDMKTICDCGSYMIRSEEGSQIITKGDAHITWGYETEKSNYSFDGIVISHLGNKTVILSDGQCYDRDTGESTECTVIRTMWIEDGLEYYSVSTVGTDLLDTMDITDNQVFKYSRISDNGRFSLVCSDQIGASRYKINGHESDSTMVVSASITGLRYSSDLPDGTIDIICERFDEIRKNCPDLDIDFTLSCTVSVYGWHDQSEPYKIFSSHAVKELRERGCTLSITAFGTTSIDLQNVEEDDDLYFFTDRAQNSYMTDAQKRIVGTDNAFLLECSSESALSKGAEVLIEQDSEDLFLYYVKDDGSFVKVDTEYKNGAFCLKIHDTGIYAFSKAKEMIIKEHPTGKDLVYNGSEQALITPASGIVGGKAEYSLDRESWSTDIPKAKDAGTYTVYYRYIATELGYSDSDVNSLTVTMSKAPDSTFSDTVTITVTVLASLMALLVLIRVLWSRRT